ncbi:MAG: hypothetical protein M9954_11705 [Cyclobacteriaceae bacterium]|nr:hypothetical protein [Cyclobacteriaceae bacterium]
MNRVILFAFLGCLGCLGEKKTDPGTPSTFVKYFNGGFNDVAQDIQPTSDGGYILLATTEVKPNEVAEARFKLKLIKTDAFGGLMWQKTYPGFDPDLTKEIPDDDSISFRGRSVMVLKDESGTDTGYIVVGDSIHKKHPVSYLHIMVTDENGDTRLSRNIKPSFAVQGKAVAMAPNGNFVVLGAAVNKETIPNIFLAELSPDLQMTWGRTYGAGASTLANRLFVKPDNSIYWSGTVTRGNDTDIRFIKTPPDSENTDADLKIGAPGVNEAGNDICNYGFGFAVIGTTDASGDDDILFKRLTSEGGELETKSYGFPNQAENGLAIAQARDGGLILLGAVDTNVDAGRGGKDYFLIKINAFGDTEWTQIFGSKNDDLGAAILANQDGSYTIFGTTLFGGLKTLALIKTDNRGRIE